MISSATTSRAHGAILPSRSPLGRLYFAPDANHTRRDNGEGVLDFLAVGLKGVRDEASFERRGEPWKPDEGHTEGNLALAKDQLAEVLVGCHQDSVPAVGAIENGLIGSAGSHLSHVVNLVAVRPESADDGRVGALVGKQVHLVVSGSG